MMTLQKGCVKKEGVPALLERLLSEVRGRKIKFDHEENDGARIFSTLFYIGNEPTTIRLTRKGMEKFILECECEHGCSQYNLHDRDIRGLAGSLYDELYHQWKGTFSA